METTPQDNRKRALDALEWRFTVAEAELLKQKRKKEVGSEKERGRKVNILPEHLPDAQGAKSSMVSARRDVQVVDPTYSVLSQPVNENLLTAPVEISSKKGTRADRIMQLLQKGDSAQKYMHGSKGMKIDGVILLDNYVKGCVGFVGSRVRALKAQSKRSNIHMSMKKHKKYGFFDLSQDLCLFHLFVPMHEIWRNYMMELLKTSGRNQLAQSLLSADLHGAIIQVAYCKITSFGGANGIMIRETAGAFGLITRDNKFLVVPKKGSIFLLRVYCWKITLHGGKLIGRDLGL